MTSPRFVTTTGRNSCERRLSRYACISINCQSVLITQQLVDTFSGAPKRHLFFNLMSLFRYEYVFMGSMIILNVLFGFASPVAINRLLE